MTSTPHPFSYLLGIGVIYLGFLFWLIECLVDPVLRARPWFRFPMMAAAIVAVWLFTAKVVLLKASLEFDAYAMRYGDYSPGTEIAGIPWDVHFTDLRIWVKNSTNEDYSDVYLEVQPDQWNYKAAIVGDRHGCDLSSMGGDAILVNPIGKGGATEIRVHNEGDQTQVSDNVGDIFQTFITQGGYRLECQGKLPAHSSVQIVFALASMDPRIASQILQPGALKPGHVGVDLEELTPRDKFSMLTSKPPTSIVTVNGHYNVASKRVTVRSLKVTVGDGN
jgi:hypothetical protein